MGSSRTCDPKITFTSVPPFGKKPPFTGPSEYTLYGRVDCINPAAYVVIVYIYPGSWWIKPSFANPKTPINEDRTWSTRIRTGGIDERATQIAAFVVPKGFDPPLLGGNAELPDVLFENAVAYLIQDRYRTIKFSGLTWNVKSSEGEVGPGPNLFSANEDKVWVDAGGNLHLTISYDSTTGKWYCTEVFTQKPLGYGTYTFTTASPIDKLDKNAVLGLFTWDDNAPQYNYREIDIEFSKWGDDANDNSQYVVQPWDQAGNMYRFNTILEGLYSTHSFKWESNQVFFSSYQGHIPDPGSEIASWLYTGPDVPPSGKAHARINLWLFNGAPPSNGQAIEVVLEAFQYEPIRVAKSFKSQGVIDGWTLESSENSNKGGTLNKAATALYLGDNPQKKQYRSILSFSTKDLPDNAVITKVTLKVKKQGITGGGNPINTFQGFVVDVKKGFFGSAPGLQASDFQATANKSYGPFKPALANGWYAINLTPAKAYINKLATGGGLTQIRLRFKLDDNNNSIANYLSLYSGNVGAASRPALIVEYYVP
jgi:hypothetical protein